MTWEGRPRPFDAVFTHPGSLPDLRILAGISEELAALGLGRATGLRTVEDARAAMAEMGPWDGPRAEPPAYDARPVTAPATGGVRVATWKQMIDLGSMQDGNDELRATARMPVVRVPASIFEAHGQLLTLTGDRGSVTLPAVINKELPDDVVWLPMRSVGRGVLADLASPGSTVTVKGAGA